MPIFGNPGFEEGYGSGEKMALQNMMENARSQQIGQHGALQSLLQGQQAQQQSGLLQQRGQQAIQAIQEEYAQKKALAEQENYQTITPQNLMNIKSTMGPEAATYLTTFGDQTPEGGVRIHKDLMKGVMGHMQTQQDRAMQVDLEKRVKRGIEARFGNPTTNVSNMPPELAPIYEALGSGKVSPQEIMQANSFIYGRDMLNKSEQNGGGSAGGQKTTTTATIGPRGPSISVKKEDMLDKSLDAYAKQVDPNVSQFSQLDELGQEIALGMRRRDKAATAMDVATSRAIGAARALESTGGGMVKPKDYLSWLNRDTGQSGQDFASKFQESQGRMPSQQDFQNAGLAFYKDADKRLQRDDVYRIINFHANEINSLADRLIPDPNNPGQMVPYLPRATGDSVKDALAANVSLLARQALGAQDETLQRMNNLRVTSTVFPVAIAPGFRPGYRSTQIMDQIMGDLTRAPMTYESFKSGWDEALRLASAGAALGGTGKIQVPQGPPPGVQTPAPPQKQGGNPASVGTSGTGWKVVR